MPVLTFKGKTAVESYHRVVPHHLLEIDPKLSLSKSPGLDGNLIIEGDNLIALKSLLPTHAGRIKCVYIDPPYNTGNEGWIYNDNLTQPVFKEWLGKVVGKEGEDATRHDKWCCMMYPRLQLLKELLREDGAIFISIDDNEVHHLRMLMDEVFGADNLLATIVWKPRYSPPNDHKGVAAMHDFIVAYRKSPEFQRGLLPRTTKSEENYSNPDNDDRGDWISVGYIGNKSRAERPNSWFAITRPIDGKQIWPDERAVWRFSPQTHAKNEREKRLYWGPDGNYAKPRFKRFRFEVKPGIVPGSWWEQSEVGHNDQAKRDLAQVLGPDVGFPNPKPVALVQRILQIATDEDDVVLDSFAGSGTTAQAILATNAEDGGARKFVLVQLPSDSDEQRPVNICERITRERIKRVIAGYSFKDSKGVKQTVEGTGGEFTYARVGRQMFDEYRDLGDKPPTFEQMARYIWFTETSRTFDAAKVDEETGHIGTWQGTSYYLLYSPSKKDARPLDPEFLRSLKDKSPRKVIYCEKLWMHRDALREFGDVRAMLVPFNLK